MYTSILSSKQGLATQALRPRLTLLIRFASLTASSSDLIAATRLAGLDLREANGAREASSEEDSSRRSRRRSRRVRCNVDSVDSLYKRDATGLHDRGNKGFPGKFSNGGMEKDGARLLVVKEWAYAIGATDRGIDDEVDSDREEEVAEERSSSESSALLVRTYDLKDDRASQPNEDVSNRIGFLPGVDPDQGVFGVDT